MARHRKTTRKKAHKLISGDVIYFDSRVRVLSELFSVGHLDGKQYILMKFTNGGMAIVPADREFEVVTGPLH